jgi:phospholipid/cholesterol/gamma-HCH transport system ATP-binding protein
MTSPAGVLEPVTATHQPAAERGAAIDRPELAPAAAAVAFEHVSLAFDEQTVLRDLSFAVPHGGMAVLLGGSGAGKSVVLKLILGLLRPDAGAVHVDGQRIDTMTEGELLKVRAGIGMLFQNSALFDSLTVAENVGYRLSQEMRVRPAIVRARVEEVLTFLGLAPLIDAMPETLSGGERRRVAIARAVASKPALLLFDDPTTGLDPVIATSVDQEIVKLRDLQHVTTIVVTHQIRDAFYIATHHAVERGGHYAVVEGGPERADATQFMVLHEGRLYFRGSASQLLASADPYLHHFLFRTLPPW